MQEADEGTCAVDKRLLLHLLLLVLVNGGAALTRGVVASTRLLPLLTTAVSAAAAAHAADADAAAPPPLWLQPALAVLTHCCGVHPDGADAAKADTQADSRPPEAAPAAADGEDELANRLAALRK